MNSMAKAWLALGAGLCLGLGSAGALTAQTTRYVALVHGGTQAGH